MEIYAVYGPNTLSGQVMAICLVAADYCGDACEKTRKQVDLEYFDEDELQAEEIGMSTTDSDYIYLLTDEVYFKEEEDDEETGEEGEDEDEEADEEDIPTKQNNEDYYAFLADVEANDDTDESIFNVAGSIVNYQIDGYAEADKFVEIDYGTIIGFASKINGKWHPEPIVRLFKDDHETELGLYDMNSETFVEKKKVPSFLNR